MATSKEDSVLFSTGRIYAETKQTAKLATLVSQLSSRAENEPQAYAKLLQGESQLNGANARQAITRFQEAQKLTDTWIGHFDLGRAYLEAGMFPEAHGEFQTCLKRRGEATAIFLDDVPTYRLLPPIYYYLGRAQEGLNSPAATDSFKTFLAMKEKADPDALITDARHRVAKQ